MGLIQVLDIWVLKASALVASVYVSVIMVNALIGKRSGTADNQALGFFILFLISLLIHLVMV
ncbi:MAG: hypothetical protein M1286_00110 [Candidatus Marsarchaeota archaeon]|nr:hypothetical protein [Candidatus Marsarchaeota archaeon]